MAHYIASLMNEAEAATGERALELRKQCSTEILNLWKHRAALPGETPPLSSFDPIRRALERLDPDRPAWERLRRFIGRDEFRGPTSELLSAAIAIDEASVHAIRTLLSEAAVAAHEHERVWITAAPQEEGDETLADFFEILDLTMDAGPTRDDKRTASLKTSIRGLDAAILAAEAARSSLMARLGSVPSDDLTAQ